MKILDIAFKDLTRSFRSAFAIGMMVVAPLMLTGLIYFAFGGMGPLGGGPHYSRPTSIGDYIASLGQSLADAICFFK